MIREVLDGFVAICNVETNPNSYQQTMHDFERLDDESTCTCSRNDGSDP